MTEIHTASCNLYWWFLKATKYYSSNKEKIQNIYNIVAFKTVDKTFPCISKKTLHNKGFTDHDMFASREQYENARDDSYLL